MMLPLLLALSLLVTQHVHSPGMDARGQLAMGFDQARATHHFIITPQGGEIRIAANDATDHKTIQEIRTHVRDIEKLFASGDFAKPEFIHGEMPPGAGAMAEMKAEISYRAEERGSGAALVITSANAKAIGAVHEYFRYQIREHKTGDPMKDRRN